MSLARSSSAPAALLPEATLLEQANELISDGYQLQSMRSLEELERWDEAVNRFLELVNHQVLTCGFSSIRLKPRIGCLLELYADVLSSLAELQKAQQDRSLELRQQRRVITG